MILIKLLIIFVFSAVCGLLGAWGGANKTSLAWRRVVMPVVLSIVAILVNWNLWFVLTMLYFLPLTQGYGIPWGTPEKTGVGDKGSLLGRLWYRIINDNDRWEEEANTKLVNIGVRGTIGLTEALVFIWIPIVKHNWVIYLICALGIISSNAIIGGYNLWASDFTFLKKKLNFNEFYLYFAITIFISVILVF